MADRNVKFDVRVLRPTDVAAMREMLNLFGIAFDDPKSYVDKQPSDDYLQKLLSGQTFIGIAAFAESRVIGGLAAYLLPKFEQDRSEIYIYDLAVTESHRREGVATAMIKKLQALAAHLNAWVVYVQADQGDEPAIKLYSKLGVREDVLHFDMKPLRSDA